MSLRVNRPLLDRVMDLRVVIAARWTIRVAGCLSHTGQSVERGRFGALNEAIQCLDRLKFGHEFVH